MLRYKRCLRKSFDCREYMLKYPLQKHINTRTTAPTLMFRVYYFVRGQIFLCSVFYATTTTTKKCTLVQSVSQSVSFTDRQTVNQSMYSLSLSLISNYNVFQCSCEARGEGGHMTMQIFYSF